MTLPSYEEAVSNSRSTAVGAENRVHIVLSEGQHASAPEAGPSRPSNLKQHQTEAAETQPAATASSSSTPSSSSAWALDHAGAAGDSSAHRRPSAGSDQQSLSLDSEMDYSDGQYIFIELSCFCFVWSLYLLRI